MTGVPARVQQPLPIVEVVTADMRKAFATVADAFGLLILRLIEADRLPMASAEML